MNPLLVSLMSSPAMPPAATPSDRASLPVPSFHPATAYDRAYIASHEQQFEQNPDLVAYDRTPLPFEWAETLPTGSFVRVFVINDCTTVRVLHSATGSRVGEPVIDSWRGIEAEAEGTADALLDD